MRKSLVTQEIPFHAFVSAVTSAVVGAACAAPWLGHGNALYVRFEASPDLASQSKRPQEWRRELSTFFCDWNLSQDQIELCNSDQPRETVAPVIAKLVGETVRDVEIDASTRKLSAAFSSGYALHFTPYAVEEEDDKSTDAWVVQDGLIYYAVTCDKSVTMSGYDL